jgi:VacB/RNase II family 3'-5' exoribonuclease
MASNSTTKPPVQPGRGRGKGQQQQQPQQQRGNTTAEVNNIQGEDTDNQQQQQQQQPQQMRSHIRRGVTHFSAINASTTTTTTANLNNNRSIGVRQFTGTAPSTGNRSGGGGGRGRFQQQRQHQQPLNNPNQPHHHHQQHRISNSHLPNQRSSFPINNNNNPTPRQQTPTPNNRFPQYNNNRTNNNNSTPHYQQRSHRNQTNRIEVTPIYTEWWDRAKVDEAIQQGTVKTGVLRVLNFRTGFVTYNKDEPDIFIDGLQNRNRATDGDIVAVEILPGFSTLQPFNPSSTTTSSIPTSSSSLYNAVPDYTEANLLWLPTVIDVSPPSPPEQQQQQQQQPSTTDNSNKKSQQPQLRGRIVSVLSTANSDDLVSERRSSDNIRTSTGFLIPPPEFARGLQPGTPLPGAANFVLFKPRDERLPLLKIPRTSIPFEFTQDPLGNPSKTLYQAQMLDWPPSEMYPRGKFIGAVGQMDTIEAQTSALLIDNNVDHGDFPEDALQELSATFLKPLPTSTSTDSSIPTTYSPWQIPPEELSSRRDLRSLCICTIDPITAKDIDDALHCIPLDDGTFEVGVHIADVSYFVKPGTLLDMEARRRCTTVYLVNKVLPMLPALLSEELCSLNPGVDRLAFSCIWKMNSDGTLVTGSKPWFGKTIIKSASKLHYGLAQQLIDQGPDIEFDDPKRLPCAPFTKADLAKTCKMLHAIAMKRREARNDPKKGGALVLQAVKMSFERDELGNPTKVETYKMYETNRMVEEYMLLANYLVAMRLIQSASDIAVLRCHPPPDERQMLNVSKLLERGAGVQLFTSSAISASGLNEALRKLANTSVKFPPHLLTNVENEEAYRKELQVVATELIKKPMKNAVYFVGAQKEKHEYRHWALNIPYYTHFTSPIRRYADVLVHRCLNYVLSNRSSQELAQDLTVEILSDLTERCNMKKESAREAQEQSDVVFLCTLLQRWETEGKLFITDAIVIDLGPNSFTVLLPELGVSKKIHIFYDFEGEVLDVERVMEEPEGKQQTSTNNKKDDDVVALVGSGENKNKQRKAEDANPIDKLSIVWRNRDNIFVDLRLLMKIKVKLVLKKDTFPLDFICKPTDEWFKRLSKKTPEELVGFSGNNNHNNNRNRGHNNMSYNNNNNNPRFSNNNGNRQQQHRSNTNHTTRQHVAVPTTSTQPNKNHQHHKNEGDKQSTTKISPIVATKKKSSVTTPIVPASVLAAAAAPKTTTTTTTTTTSTKKSHHTSNNEKKKDKE